MGAQVLQFFVLQHIILQSPPKFLAPVFPLPLIPPSETWSSHSPSVLVFPLGSARSLLSLSIFHGAVCTFHLPVPPTSLSFTLPLLQMCSCQIPALVWFHQSGPSALTAFISFCKVLPTQHTQSREALGAWQVPCLLPQELIVLVAACCRHW